MVRVLVSASWWWPLIAEESHSMSFGMVYSPLVRLFPDEFVLGRIKRCARNWDRRLCGQIGFDVGLRERSFHGQFHQLGAQIEIHGISDFFPEGGRHSYGDGLVLDREGGSVDLIAHGTGVLLRREGHQRAAKLLVILPILIGPAERLDDPHDVI